MTDKECHECSTICKSDQIIYRIFPKKTHYIETSVCWVLGKDVCNGKANLTNCSNKDIWTYCYDCYINFSLNFQKHLCSNCGCYDTYCGIPPSLKKDSFFISGNGAIGSFSFPQDKKPVHLDTDGFLCMSCIQHFVIDGTLISDKKYTDTLNSVLLSQNKPLPSVAKICNLCKNNCKKINYFDASFSDSDSELEPDNCQVLDTNCNSPHQQYEQVFAICDKDNTDKDTLSENTNYNSDDEYNNLYNILINENKGCNASGSFQIKTDDEDLKIKMSNLKYPITICDKCMLLFGIDYINNMENTCDLCCNNTWCGSQCSLLDTGVCCGYGSSYDMNKYRWKTGGKPKNLKNIHNICDNCLEHFINNGCLIADGQYM